MGVSYGGSMIIGETGELLSVPEELEEEFENSIHEWLDDEGMISLSEYCDAPEEDNFFGFQVDDVSVSEMNNEWFNDIKYKAKRFEEITGVPARLIGAQDIG